MSKYVNADAICYAADETAKEYADDRMMLAIIQGIKNLANRMHGIDIVRCGECKKRKKNRYCLEHKRYEKDDEGFCSYGERSE